VYKTYGEFANYKSQTIPKTQSLFGVGVTAIPKLRKRRVAEVVRLPLNLSSPGTFEVSRSLTTSATKPLGNESAT
jgi:hypothetical protein